MNFEESFEYSRQSFVAGRGVSAFLWLLLLGTLALVILLPVSSWNGIWFCLIFGIGYPLVGIAQSALNFRRHPTGMDARLRDGVLTFTERFDHDDETFVGSSCVSVPLGKCGWRLGFAENLVSCHFHILPFSSFFPWRRTPVIEIVFHSRDSGEKSLSKDRICVYPLGFTEGARNVWRSLLTEADLPRLRDRGRWEMLFWGFLLFLFFVLLRNVFLC